MALSKLVPQYPMYNIQLSTKKLVQAEHWKQQKALYASQISPIQNQLNVVIWPIINFGNLPDKRGLVVTGD